MRVSTGIPGCNDILGGGFIEGRTYLLAGNPGSGKTLFSLQWLLDGASRGEKCLYVTLSEPAAVLARDAEALGWSVSGLDIVDLSPVNEELNESPGEYHVFSPSEVESVPAWNAIYQALRASSPQRVMIDSATELRYLATDEYQFRKNMVSLINFLNNAGVTSLIAFDAMELDRDNSVARAVDGVIRLRSEISPALAIGMRSIQVDKMRGSDFMSGRHPFRITERGISVFPHLIEHTGAQLPGERILSSGIHGLDALLGGGIESGTTTLLTGPTGTGKSTLGTQFLAHHAAEHRAILFTFEEPPGFIITRSRLLGSPIDSLVDCGDLRIVRVNPLELYPDEFLALVREAVEVDRCSMVMIDSLRGYQFAMEEFGKPQAHIHNLVSYLSRQGVTTVLINEVEHITSTSLKATDFGVSHLADNIVLLRYAEYAGQVIKVVGCLKKRIGHFEPELRQVQVDARGIRISEKLEHLCGVLTGVPAFATPAV